MKITVLFFAGLRDATGSDAVELEFDAPPRESDVKARLAALYPQVAELLGTSRLAQKDAFLDSGQAVIPGEDIAVIPPVSGGVGYEPAVLTHKPLNAAALEKVIHRLSAGAVVVFQGTARTPNQGREVEYLEYEAHPSMALAVMQDIVREAENKWPGTTALLHHRLGRVLPGEVSVVAAASTPHRSEAFEACRFVIERLKHDVPIWKKEVWTDGSEWVGQPGTCVDH